MTRQNRFGRIQSESLSCEDVLILWCNSVARSVGNACTQRGGIYVTFDSGLPSRIAGDPC